jgi:two-component system, NtrC family, sensor kinase
VNDGLRTRLGAVVLAFLTLAAIIFAALNYQQSRKSTSVYDGIVWANGNAVVDYTTPGSPASKAGIKPGDLIESVGGVRIERSVDVARVLWHAGLWTQVTYGVARQGEHIQVPLITEPYRDPYSIADQLRLTALLYLFIGLFIFVRRWTAPRAVHFYLFCLVSFVLYSFRFTGKLNSFDQTIYWGNEIARLLQPALLLHFALVFPERRRAAWSKVLAVYGLPLGLLALHFFVATSSLNFVPSIGAERSLDKIELTYLAMYFLAAAAIFFTSYWRAPKGLLRQQLKWVTCGTAFGILPFVLFYVLPYTSGMQIHSWMKLATCSLALIPLCYGYAVIRYRLMDVDIIFKRGLAHTFAVAAIAAVYFAIVALIGELSHTAWPTGPLGAVIAIIVAAFLFQPVRDWGQAHLDRMFYRDRLNYRRTLIEFGRTLTNEVRLEPLLSSALDRISQTLLVDRLAIFLEDPSNPGQFAFSHAMGMTAPRTLDLGFLDPQRPALARGCLFFESARSATQESESVRNTLQILDLNYFIPCRFRERTVAVLGLGKTVDGDFLSSEDVELLFTIAGYVAIAIENARLYQSLEQKAIQVERLKDFSENIVESLKIGVVTVDLEDRIESWNSQLEDLLEIPREAAIRRNLADVFPPDLVAEISSHGLTGHVSSIYKHHLNGAGGRRLVVNVSIAPLLGKDSARLGRLILVDDITQRMRLEEQMVQTEKLTSLGLLAAGVAHEVNTPLAVISNYIQMLAKQIAADDPRQKTIERIVKQTFRASEIVNNLLNFSRTGSIEFSEVDLNSVLEETLTLVQHPFRTARVNVIKNYTEHLPLVLGSSTRLQQVFLNLFMNARDAMPNGGMLEVRTGAHNGSVEIEVTDTGTGIATENLNRIFDPFFTTKASGRGTGLGLSVSYGIIKEHAGKVDVRSTLGKGTSFRLEFPVARKAVHA